MEPLTPSWCGSTARTTTKNLSRFTRLQAVGLLAIRRENGLCSTWRNCSRQTSTPQANLFSSPKAKNAWWRVHLSEHATTSSHGSESAHKTDWAPMAGRLAVILPDKDKRGDGYAQSVAALLLQLSPPATVKIGELPGLTEKGDDCVEWITARNGKPP